MRLSPFPCREEKLFLLERRFPLLEKRFFSQSIPIEWITLGDVAYPIGLGAFVLKSPGNALPGSFLLRNRMGIRAPRYISFSKSGIERCD